MGQSSTPESNEQQPVKSEPGLNETLERLRKRRVLGVLWLVEYGKAIFSFDFSKYLIIQMIPIFYGLVLAGLFIGFLALTVNTFLAYGLWRGLFMVFIGGPLGFLVCASLFRATVEFYLVIFRIAEDVDQLAGMTETVDKLSGLSNTVTDMADMAERMPIFKFLRRIGVDGLLLSGQRTDKEKHDNT